jgi:aminopeptidase N
VVIFPTVIRYVLTFAIDRFLPPEARPAARARIGEACRGVLEQAEPGSGLQLAAARALIGTAGPDDAGWLRSWLDDGTVPPAGLAIDSDLRWTIMQQLAVLGAASSADIDAEYDREPTQTTAINAAKARASRPDAAAKEIAWNQIISDDSISNHLLFATAEGFWQPDQIDLLAPYVERFVADVPEMASKRVPQVSEFLIMFGYPHSRVDADDLAKLTEMVAGETIEPVIARLVRDGNDDLARAIRAREVALASA